MCWEKQVRPLTENTRGPIHFLGYQKPGGWNNRNVLSQVLEAICPGSRYPWGWFLLRVEREGCVPCSLLASGGSPAILGILWLVEASLHLCPNLQVFSLDVHLYLNFLVFIGTVVLPDSVQFSLLTQSCPTLCDPMDCSMPGLPVQHQLTGLGAPILQYGLPWWLSDKESTCQCRRCGFDPRVGKVPWRRKWQSTPIFLPGKSHGQRSLAGYSPWDHEESDMT